MFHYKIQNYEFIILNSSWFAVLNSLNSCHHKNLIYELRTYNYYEFIHLNSSFIPNHLRSIFQNPHLNSCTNEFICEFKYPRCEFFRYSDLWIHIIIHILIHIHHVFTWSQYHIWIHVIWIYTHGLIYELYVSWNKFISKFIHMMTNLWCNPLISYMNSYH